MDMRGFAARVDKDACIGCGLCEETLPQLFSMGDFTAYSDGVVGEDLLQRLLIAARDCPVEAISYHEVELLDAPGDHHEKGNDVEERSEIAEYQREHGDLSDLDEVETNDAESLERGEHNLTIVRNGTDDD
jgi:ferredoxin